RRASEASACARAAAAAPGAGEGGGRHGGERAGRRPLPLAAAPGAVPRVPADDARRAHQLAPGPLSAAPPRGARGTRGRVAPRRGAGQGALAARRQEAAAVRELGAEAACHPDGSREQRGRRRGGRRRRRDREPRELRRAAHAQRRPPHPGLPGGPLQQPREEGVGEEAGGRRRGGERVSAQLGRGGGAGGGGPVAGAARTPGRWRPRRSDRCYRASRWPTRCVLTRCRTTSGRAGPPGCGKTTLAHIIANNSKKHSIRFVTLSATNAKTNDVRDVIKQAQNEKSFFKRKTVLFIDEIHRFNKSQQDTFLPHVECGTITLIGATTENPSFQVNAALLSRCRVIVLEKLPVEAMVTILMRAINSLGIHVLDSSRPTDPLSHSSNSSSEPAMFIEDKAVDTLAYLSDGDARAGLNGLQLAVLARLSSRKMFCKKSGQSYSPSRVLITENDVKEGLQRSHILYDRAGEEHYNCISALHKSMRGSDQNASLYWLARMLEGGEDPLYVARRLVRFASEDIGLADPSALTQAVAAYQGCHFIGMPECEVVAQTVGTKGG
uniref:WRN helicase interacting protein 1 n=1 Tax=Papio anubis TaxID=9555 RepID=A0A8I5N546_PAPAN